jgi:hypothetical protein
MSEYIVTYEFLNKGEWKPVYEDFKDESILDSFLTASKVIGFNVQRKMRVFKVLEETSSKRVQEAIKKNE